MSLRLKAVATFALLLVPVCAFAWTGPTQSPPNGNVAAPINTGSSAQTKSGDFAITGNFGVGTLTPLAKLEVSNSSASEANQLVLYNPSNGATASQALSFKFGSGYSAGAKIVQGYSGGTYLAFTAGSTEGLRIIANGNVGIGTNNPAYKLQVAGDVYANGGWLRTSGTAGWYSETYGGGWFMQDTSWMRVYGNKGIYTGNVIRADSGFCVGGTCRTQLGPIFGGVYEYNPGTNDICPGDDLVYGVGVYNYQVGNLCTNNGCISSYHAGTTVWCRDVY